MLTGTATLPSLRSLRVAVTTTSLSSLLNNVSLNGFNCAVVCKTGKQQQPMMSNFFNTVDYGCKDVLHTDFIYHGNVMIYDELYIPEYFTKR